MNKINKISSESIVNDLLKELEFLRSRLRNIKDSYLNASNNILRSRLIEENHNLIKRINHIYLIARAINKRNDIKVSFSNLLIEICGRTISEMNLNRNLFIL